MVAVPLVGPVFVTTCIVTSLNTVTNRTRTRTNTRIYICKRNCNSQFLQSRLDERSSALQQQRAAHKVGGDEGRI